MFDYVASVVNYLTVPSPVPNLTDPSGVRIEQRLQVTLKSASNEQTYTVEFRLGEGSQAPSEKQLNEWLERGELVQAFCTGLTARPFVHQEGKTYRRKGKEVQVAEGTTAELDAFVVFAGFAMAPLEGGPPLEELVRQAHAAYTRSQRHYREQRNAERLQLLEAQMQERVRQMQARQAAQAAQGAPAATPAGAVPVGGEAGTARRGR
jgi:hypothetical protein